MNIPLNPPPKRKIKVDQKKEKGHYIYITFNAKCCHFSLYYDRWVSHTTIGLTTNIQNIGCIFHFFHIQKHFTYFLSIYQLSILIYYKFFPNIN